MLAPVNGSRAASLCGRTGGVLFFGVVAGGWTILTASTAVTEVRAGFETTSVPPGVPDRKVGDGGGRLHARGVRRDDVHGDLEGQAPRRPPAMSPSPHVSTPFETEHAGAQVPLRYVAPAGRRR